MNPDHADESDDDMPRAVYDALKKHNAMDDELCRVVAGDVWCDMQDAYDDIYGMWREEMRAARELERERDRLRQELAYIAEAQPATQGDDWRNQFQEWAQSRARAALEGKP